MGTYGNTTDASFLYRANASVNIPEAGSAEVCGNLSHFMKNSTTIFRSLTEIRIEQVEASEEALEK